VFSEPEQLNVIASKVWKGVQGPLGNLIDDDRGWKYSRTQIENVMKVTECFLSLQTSVVIIQQYNVMVNGYELIGTTEYLTL
jgi:hypothetical protein